MRALLLPALVLSACDPCASSCRRAVDSIIMLGEGESSFTPLADGDRVPMVFGPQGGFHVWGAVRTEGIGFDRSGSLSSPCQPQVNFFLEAIDGSFEGRGGGRRALSADGELVGERIFLDFGGEDPPAEAQVEITVRVSDVCGNEVSDTRQVVAACQDPASCPSE